jgi:dipeptidyl aminopeptidase/acylaminoacyl peptidase
MKNGFLFFIILPGLLAPSLFSQSGKIIEEREIPFTQEINQNIQNLGKALPKLNKFLEGIPQKALLVRVSEITYLSDGLKVKGFLLEPKKEGKFPCLIVNRGGNRDFSIWTKEETFILLAEISSWGYIVAASQYRGCAGGEGKEEFGGKDVDDVLSLIPLLESRSKADPEHIGIIGTSRGGMMTYLALSRTNRFKAAAVVSGVSDLIAWEKARPDMEKVFNDLIGGNSESAPDSLKARSALYWPEKLHKQTPILILHGTSDERVPPGQALDMASALLRFSHPFRLVMLEGGDHNLSDFWPEWLDIVRSWFEKFLGTE